MWRYVSFLIITWVMMTGAFTSVSAQEVLSGRVTAIDRETGRITLETLPTLLQPASKQIDIDLSLIDHDQWKNLEHGDTVRAWVNSTDGSSVSIVRALQRGSAGQQRQSDPTGVRQRLSSQGAAGIGSPRSPAGTRSSGGRR